MKIAVWDTYVIRENGLKMHFDILVPDKMNDEATIFNYGRKYLKDKPFETGNLSTNECAFCHVEKATQSVEDDIIKKGFSIIEMENCN